MRPMRVEGELPKPGDRVVVNQDQVGLVERIFEMGGRRFAHVKFGEEIETIELRPEKK